MDLLAGSHVAARYDKVLARIWALIDRALGVGGFVHGRDIGLDWMPSHKSLDAALVLCMESGRRVEAVDWRGNRLVDAAAKEAASMVRVGERARAELVMREAALEFHLVWLGIVTFKANNCQPCIGPTLPGGGHGPMLRDADVPHWATLRKRKAVWEARAATGSEAAGVKRQVVAIEERSASAIGA